MTEAVLTIRDLIVKYVEIRNAKTKLQEQHKLAIAPYDDALAKLEGVFMQEMDRTGVDSVSARDAGTIYRTTRANASVADFEALKSFVLDHDAWELLQARVSTPAVEAYLEDTGDLPPGVNLSRVMKINVRKD